MVVEFEAETKVNYKFIGPEHKVSMTREVFTDLYKRWAANQEDPIIIKKFVVKKLRAVTDNVDGTVYEESLTDIADAIEIQFRADFQVTSGLNV